MPLPFTSDDMFSLAHKVNLPEPTPYDQDWEYVVADSSRIDEFIYHYQTIELNQGERFLLMIIIVESLNDALSDNQSNPDDNNRLSQIIEQLLMANYTLHQETIEYYAYLGNSLEDAWFVAPIMRRLIRTANKCNF